MSLSGDCMSEVLSVRFLNADWLSSGDCLTENALLEKASS